MATIKGNEWKLSCKEETKKRVLKAIEELNYIPNMQARELTQRKSTTIGVIVPSLTNLFYKRCIWDRIRIEETFFIHYINDHI